MVKLYFTVLFYCERYPHFLLFHPFLMNVSFLFRLKKMWIVQFAIFFLEKSSLFSFVALFNTTATFVFSVAGD